MIAGTLLTLLWCVNNWDAQLLSLSLAELIPVRDLDKFGLTMFPAKEMKQLFGTVSTRNGESITVTTEKMLV